MHRGTSHPDFSSKPVAVSATPVPSKLDRRNCYIFEQLKVSFVSADSNGLLPGGPSSIFQFAGVRSPPMDTPIPSKLVYNGIVARTNININETLIRKAKKLTRLKTKREIVDRALELLVRSEDRKSILQYHGSGIWKGNYKLARRNRV
jgi:Arc/MetJ family transcription regulator